jgi:1-acyl-sn-glycerol-3-phosphate acyltransferase
MMDAARAPQYLYDDFVHPAWHLNRRFGLAVSAALSHLTVGLMHGLGCVSVDRNRGRNLSAFRHSLALLNQGKNLLVFPEDPKGLLDPETRMRPFLCGFVSLCSMYERATGRPLPMYPLVVSSQAKTVSIDTPIFFGPRDNHRHNIRVVCACLRAKMEALYRSLHNSRLPADKRY